MHARHMRQCVQVEVAAEEMPVIAGAGAFRGVWGGGFCTGGGGNTRAWDDTGRTHSVCVRTLQSRGV